MEPRKEFFLDTVVPCLLLWKKANLILSALKRRLKERRGVHNIDIFSEFLLGQISFKHFLGLSAEILKLGELTWFICRGVVFLVTEKEVCFVTIPVLEDTIHCLELYVHYKNSFLGTVPQSKGYIERSLKANLYGYETWGSFFALRLAM